jgi:hypothetical protein
MSRRLQGDLIAEYHFLKRKVKKMIVKAENSGPLQQPRMIKKIANLMRKLLTIEEDCKSMDLPHPDAFNQEEPSLNELTKSFGRPEVKAVMNPDGTLYSKNNLPQVGSGALNKITVKSNPDGRLFETPPLEGTILPRRTEAD